MQRFRELDDLLDHIWSYVRDGVENRQNAMTTPVFATDGPAARTVALRRCDVDTRRLMFHTDVRSQKVDQLAETPRAVWVGWDESSSQQFQFAGRTTVHADDAVADDLWATEPEENLGFYYKRAAPGDVLDQPVNCLEPAKISDERAREHFAAVRTIVDEITWLHLHPNIEYRARFRWDGERFEGEWIVP